MSDQLVTELEGALETCRSSRELLLRVAAALRQDRSLAYHPTVEGIAQAAAAQIDSDTFEAFMRAHGRDVRFLQQFYKFPYGISA